jgi:hypothetical protein
LDGLPSGYVVIVDSLSSSKRGMHIAKLMLSGNYFVIVNLANGGLKVGQDYNMINNVGEDMGGRWTITLKDVVR